MSPPEWIAQPAHGVSALSARLGLLPFPEEALLCPFLSAPPALAARRSEGGGVLPSCPLLTGHGAACPRPCSHRVENSSDCSPGLPCWRSREGQWLPRPPGRFSPENPVSLLSVTRWTGSSVMAAAVGGSIRSVLVSLPRRPRRRTTCVRAVRRRTRRAGDKTRRAPSVRTWPGDSQFLSKAAGLAFKPACKRCYFYSLWDHFSRTL